MNQDIQPEARLYCFLQEIYGYQPTATRVEVDVEGQSGGVYGTPHLEATEVRVYAEDAQLLPDFEAVPYWKEMLAAYPLLFLDCTMHLERLDMVQELLKRERLYLDYGLDWPDVNEKVVSPLHFTVEELWRSYWSDRGEKPDGRTNEGTMRNKPDEIVKGRLKQQAAIYRYLEELVVYTPEEAQAIIDASEYNPWLDQEVNNALGSGHVLSVVHLEAMEESVVIPANVTGRHRLGLFIDGTLTDDVLQHFRTILGEQRVWLAWPDSVFALVVPDLAYANPMNDPLLAQLAQAIPLIEAFRTLAELNLSFIELYEGFLLAQNKHGQFETWWTLPDGRGIDEDISEWLPVLEYEGDLYSYGNAYSSKEEVYSAIQHEIGK